jgi:hypothetical protein
MHILILDTTPPPELLEVEKHNLAPFVARRQARREELLEYRCGSVCLAGVDFDAGEGVVGDWGGEAEAGPGELVVHAHGHEHVVGWLGCVAVFELRGESVRKCWRRVSWERRTVDVIVSEVKESAEVLEAKKAAADRTRALNVVLILRGV